MGGRGGSSGLSGGSSLPQLEGSEKQVLWAQDVRDRWVFTDQEIKRAVESKSTSGIDMGTRAAMERLVLAKHKDKFENLLFRMREQFKSEQYTRAYVKAHGIEMTADFKASRKEDSEKAKKKYKKWLVKEYKKILNTERSAKWWIDRR